MTETIRQRDRSVDIVRGIAILMVVLGHTISVITTDFENTFTYNIIWSLQMPLFFVISGYVTRYSRQISNGKAFGKFVFRRTIAYMVPWTVWTFLIRGIVFGQAPLLDLNYLLYNMDSGYWFLFSIYVITVIIGFSEFLASKINKSQNVVKKTVLTTIFYLIGAGVLMSIGILMGMSFLCIKLTLYYMPFYFVGYFFGKFKEELLNIGWIKKSKETFIAVAVIIYVFIIVNIELYSLSESLFDIVLRAATSLFGCIALCSLISNFAKSKNKIFKFLDWAGVHSLEIYLLQYLTLNIFRLEEAIKFSSPKGFLLVGVNFLVTIAIIVVLIKILNQNKVLKGFLFGKEK